MRASTLRCRLVELSGVMMRKKKVGRPAVHRLEIDALAAAAKADHQLVDILRLAVRNSDAAADAGAAQPLAFEQNPHQVLVAGGAVFGQRGDKFLQDFLFVLSLQVSENGVSG